MNDMTERERVFVVDRLEGETAVLVADEGSGTLSVPRGELPAGVSEGAVLRVPLAADGTPSWADAVLDEELRVERLRGLQERLEALKRRDPGGDITM